VHVAEEMKDISCKHSHQHEIDYSTGEHNYFPTVTIRKKNKFHC